MQTLFSTDITCWCRYEFGWQKWAAGLEGKLCQTFPPLAKRNSWSLNCHQHFHTPEVWSQFPWQYSRRGIICYADSICLYFSRVYVLLNDQSITNQVTKAWVRTPTHSWWCLMLGSQWKPLRNGLQEWVMWLPVAWNPLRALTFKYITCILSYERLGHSWTMNTIRKFILCKCHKLNLYTWLINGNRIYF